MSASRARIRRVYAATGALMEAIRPGAGAEWVRRFRRRFIAPASIYESGAHVLEEMGVHRSDALLLSLVPGIVRCMQLESYGRSPRLGTFASAASYLKALFLGRMYEHFYMLALGPSGRLIECVLLQKGTTDRAAFYVRHVLREAVRTKARALVIAHNHPNNTLRPSNADVACTLSLLSALEPLGIPLLDHVVVADQRAVSMRQVGMIYEATWMAQAPEDALLRGWLEGAPSEF